MRARLLFPDSDFRPNAPLPWNGEALAADLGLPTLLEAMARDDPVILAVARTALLTGFGNDIETIRYRQEVFGDCLRNPDVVRQLYAIAVEATAWETGTGRSSLSRNPDWVLRWASATIESFLGALERLRRIAESQRQAFTSAGLGGLLSSLADELGADYWASARDALRRLKFRDGLMLGVALGKGNGSAGHVLLEPPARGRMPWLVRLIERVAGPRRDPYSLTFDPDDEVGVKALAVLRDQGLALAAGALGESADHIRAFLGALRTELAFYVGCLNLHEELGRSGAPLCLPVPAPAEARRLQFEGLCDPALALTIGRGVVGNDATADDRQLVVVTGANQGGKSTFLRSLGLAQMMMQSGMFVSARSFSSSLVDGLATHFRREEDPGMESGKFDDELGRMSEIVDRLTPHAMILFNESFAATNEREGSEIARQIILALLDRGVRMICVTHFYELAQGFCDRDDVLFLRADRRDDGTRSFRLVEGEPLRTSFGEDLYDEIFPAGEPRPPAARRPRRGRGE